MQKEVIGIIGAGTMGNTIAQFFALSGHKVFMFDAFEQALSLGKEKIRKSIESLLLKGKITESLAKEAQASIHIASSLEEFKECNLIIEAVIEDLTVKQQLFKSLELVTSANCIFATNTSSLSITSIASACKNSGRFIGIHFFNPATIMPLVEIIPGIATSYEIVEQCKTMLDACGKTTVIAKDTPGFIVNRIARPFYGEALRIYEEGIAGFATIDWAMKEIGGFKMGPFELMDFIGNDVNFKVTETVWQQFFYEPRYKPSLTQKRLFEAGFWGKKTGRGYYDYAEGALKPEPEKDTVLGNIIFNRIITMLINEAYDAVYYKVASPEDIETAMIKGVNYPKGLLKWGEELGLQNICYNMEVLYDLYREDRYRPGLLLKQANTK
jgi:3-hydroxybutyryl-CoA dehydrogenase